MKELDVVISGVKLITPNENVKVKEIELHHSYFQGLEHYFPQGLPQRLAGLDRGTKYLLAAVKEALHNKKFDEEKSVGVAIATFLGCSTSRLKFLNDVLKKEKCIANPILFKTTVPSVAAGAVSILYQCCGPTITCIGQGDAGLAALHNASLLIQRGITKRMIVGGYEDLPPELMKIIPRRVQGNATWQEGGGVLVLENATMTRNDGNKPLAKICGINVCGHGQSLRQKREALHDVMKATTSLMDNNPIECIISAGSSYLSVEKAMFPDVPVIDITAQWGESLGMSGIVRLIAAIGVLNIGYGEVKRNNQPSGVLINGVGVSGTAYTVMLSKNIVQA